LSEEAEMKILTSAVILLAVVAVIAIGDDLKQGDAAKYRISQAGVEVGQGSYLVTRADENGMEIKGDVLLTTPTGQVSISTTTETDASGTPKAYRLFATLPGNSTQELEITFAQGKAEALILIGGSQREQTIDLPEDWIIFDNNTIPHQVLLASRLKPDMEPVTGHAFVPQALRLVDYSLEAAGRSEYELSGKKLICTLYKMNIASMVDVNLYVADGQLVALVQIQGDVKFELITE
jgi:hypothetical protein